MPKFKDSAGQEWNPIFNVTLAREIRQTCEVDLLTLVGKGQAIARMEHDRDLLARVLWVACSDQAAKAGVRESQFCSRLAGDVFNAAHKAFNEAVLEFLRVPEHLLGDQRERQPQPSLSAQALSNQQFVRGPMREPQEFSTFPGEQIGGNVP